VVNNERRLGRLVVEKVAQQLAETFPAERMAAQLRHAWEGHPTWPDIQARLRAGAEQWRTHFHLPELPTFEEVRRRAADAGYRVPEVSLDEVAERARQLVIEAVSVRVLRELEPLPA
jgi:hypothetical protein